MELLECMDWKVKDGLLQVGKTERECAEESCCALEECLPLGFLEWKKWEEC
jgi:hypothetical protein